jgi:hypothetical protein
MMTTERAVGFVLAAAATAGLAWASRLPIDSDRADAAVLRLAWRARPERIEHCVTQSPEALAALPPHMRQTTICEGINASYRLEVRRNGEVLASQRVEPGGLRRDRPLYVFREVPLPPGESMVRITFERIEDTTGDDDEEHDERETLRETVPALLAWEATLTLAPGQVRVISYDPSRRALVEVQER